MSHDPRHEPGKQAAKREPAKPAAKAAPTAIKNASHGATASLAPAAGPKRIMPSLSVGSPTEGHLINGARLADAPYLRVYPVYAAGDVRWGVEPLVGLIDRAAKTVRAKFPDAVLSIGHLSRAGGGELDRHASHESGRDADIGFYVRNATGKPLQSDQMVAFLGDGTAPHWPGAHFDDARNWQLVASMLSDGRTRVTHIFVATPIRQRLLAYAEKIGAPPAIRTRAAEVLAQPHGALPHDDHFHVRIACPSGMDRCIELPTVKRRNHPGSAVASHGHPAHPSQAGAHAPTAQAHASNASPGSSSAASASAASAAGRAAPARPGAPSSSPAPAAPARPAPKADPHAEESARSESLIPSLSPAVPGLDSAVIPSPLVGVKSTWGISKDVPPAPKPDAVSDPDGVLDPSN